MNHSPSFGPYSLTERHSVRRTRGMIALGTACITLLMVVGLIQASPDATGTAWGLVHVGLFTLLTSWIAFGFCVALSGTKAFSRSKPFSQSNHQAHPCDVESALEAIATELLDGIETKRVHAQADSRVNRIALVVPIYNEDPAAVMACVQATAESLKRTGETRRFDLFILSDTTDPEVWVREEILWSKVRADLGSDSPAVHYRHRVDNRSRKAGNIGEFLERWGSDYKYFVILDADSTMDGRTLVEMARRMDTNDRLGILQSPPIPEGRESVWARAQQFSARAYGPLFNYGLIAWTGRDGNYWGHNAMIRTHAFLRHCGLSKLPGREPLGGEILSHDFVEAALMRRAGYEVRLAADLDGGFEQCPTTVEDHARRDQRWCQGNMQHLRIAVAPAWHPVSRWHFFSGAMSYLASPLWLMFLLGGVLMHLTSTENQANPMAALMVFAAAMTMLLLPKIIAVAIHMKNDATGYGGKRNLFASMVTESMISMAVAPVMMLYHSRFALTTLMGRKVRWNAQVRTDDGITTLDAIKCHGVQTLTGLVSSVLLFQFTPELLLWASPLLFGLLFAVPLGKALASPTLGRWLAGHGLLLTPEETSPPRVLRRRDVLQRKYEQIVDVEGSTESFFGAVISNPVLYRLHLNLLAASIAPPDHAGETRTELTRGTLRKVRRTIRKDGVESIPKSLRRKILSDPKSLRQLHLEHWSNRLAA